MHMDAFSSLFAAIVVGSDCALRTVSFLYYAVCVRACVYFIEQFSIVFALVSIKILILVELQNITNLYLSGEQY